MTTRMLTAVILLTLALAACGSDPAVETSAETTLGATTETTESTTSDADGGGGSDGRAFDATDDAVITALEAALASNNARAEWDGSEIVIHMDGSTDDPTAWLPCTAAEGLIAADETVRLVYTDGDLICSERPGI